MLIKTEHLATLSFPISDNKRICECKCKPSFMSCDSSVFNKNSAKIALSLSLSTVSESAVQHNLSALDFGDTVSISYNNTDKSRIGICIGCKRVDGDLLVCVVLKGTSGGEWYSNFDIGYMAEHHGFSVVADYAEEKLYDYVFTRAIGCNPKFFITGYSRGGAVANILSKRLCDRYGTDRVFAYTFASPSTTISRRVNRYGSIFNLIRDEDFFTKIPPEGWGYTKYGRTLSLSENGDFTERFKVLTDEEYIGFADTKAIDGFICAVMRLAPNVLAYYHRRREVGGLRLSLYEFMCHIADMLAQNMDDSTADTFLSAMVSDYADILSFMSSGADLYELIGSAGGVPRCSISDSHSPAAYYLSAMAMLGE